MTTVSEAKWTTATRKAYHKEHPENFAGSDMSYPIKDKSDVGDAWGLAGHASNPDAVRRKIISIAKRLGFTDALPDTAKDFMAGKKKESSESVSVLSSPVSSLSSNRPRARIATIQVRWIEDNARSLNGRIYPKEAVDRLIASAVRKLADPESLPITCFLSHTDADEDRTPALIGRVTNVWREGTRGMATIDLADTGPARDALALISGGYLCTESLRARGAELRTDKRYDVPVVGGDNLELEGIDLTNYPGLEQVARIQQIHLAESSQKNNLTEVFAIAPSFVQFKFKELGMSKKLSPLTEAKLREEGILPRVSGDSPSMTSDDPSSPYQQRLMPVPDLTDPADMPTATSKQLMEAHQRAHDHLANVLDATLTPIHSMESLIPLSKPLTEEGKKLARKHAEHLMAAHDESAMQLGMPCAGGYGMQGGYDDDDSDESSKSKNGKSGKVRPTAPANPQMTPGFANQSQTPGVPAQATKRNKPFQPATSVADNMEGTKKERKRALKEALALLEGEGYNVHLDRKKTESEALQEQLAALKADQARQMAEMKELLLKSNRAPAQLQPAPQRRSQVVGANIGAPMIGGQPMHGRHLQEQIKSLDWNTLADRTAPLPDIPLELLIKDFEQYYAIMYDNKYGILTAAGQ